MTDEEYLEKYQKEYGILTEKQKKEVLKYFHDQTLSDEELLKKLKEL